MKLFHLNDMKNGWFIGNFNPHVIKTPGFEVAVKEYKSGESEACHYHKIAEEITLIASGEVRMCGRVFTKGDIIVLSPGEETGFEAISDATTVVVKIPSVDHDKYLKP